MNQLEQLNRLQMLFKCIRQQPAPRSIPTKALSLTSWKLWQISTLIRKHNVTSVSHEPSTQYQPSH
jgi:hypothetical protein